MPKAIEASCVGGVVTADGLPVAAATILSEGVGQSEGTLILDEDRAFYIAKTVADLKTTLEQAIAALNQGVTAFTEIATALTAIGAGMTGPTTAPPPTLPTSVTNITNAATQITAATTQLSTLKEMLK